MIINVENSNTVYFNLWSKFTTRTIECCPHCKSTFIIKHGTFNGRQRHKCNDCLRTFSPTTNTPLYHSRKPISCWRQFLDLMLSNTSLRDCSHKLKLGLKTCFSWRHKLLNALDLVTQTTELKNCIEMRKIFLKENKKGQKDLKEISGKKVWVIVSSDCNDDTFAEPISLGSWLKNNFTKLVYSKINKDAYIKTFGDSYIKSIAIKHNQKKFERNDYSSKELIFNFIGNIKGIISKCRGVATKYLPHYFSLAKIVSLNKEYSACEVLDMISFSDSYIRKENLKEIVPVYQSV